MGLLRNIMGWRPWRRASAGTGERQPYFRNATLRGNGALTPDRREAGHDGGDDRIRRWDGAKTNRLNQEQWAGAKGQSINQDLQASLEILWTRCDFEMANNAFAAGMANTYATDLVGDHGPRLQVISENEAWNSALEELMQWWFARADHNGQMTFAAILAQWVRNLFPRGEFLAQITTDDSAKTLIKTRLLNIESRRLRTPSSSANSNKCVLGVEVTDSGRPVRYFIADVVDLLNDPRGSLEPKPYEAKDIIHGFEIDEPGQVRGVPLLATTLQAAADVRSYDKEVLTCARVAARHTVLWQTDHPEAEYLAVNETADIDYGAQTTGPPGWKATQMKSEQPVTGYDEFRDARLLEIGRPVHMPLMILKLNSADHNYSSARFDSGVYARGIETRRARTLESHLCRLVGVIAREAMLAIKSGNRMLEGEGESGVPMPNSWSILGGAMPANWRCQWTWPTIPPVDENKTATAAQTRLQTGVSTIIDELAAKGENLEDHLAKKKREIQAFAEAGIEYPNFGLSEPAPADDGAVDDAKAAEVRKNKKRRMFNVGVTAAGISAAL